MKNFLDSESIIYKDYTNIITDNFYNSRYGINRCSREVCEDLADIRFELLQYQLYNQSEISSQLSVYAGTDKIAQINTTQIFSAIIDPGIYPIDTILWEQISGDPATFSGETTSILTVTSFSTGESEFRITVTDTNGDIATDTVLLTGINLNITSYYGMSDTNIPPTLEEILAGISIDVPSNTNPIIPFESTLTPKYFWYAELATETVKTKWEDIVVSLNSGNIGTEEDLFGVPNIVSIYRVYQTTYATQFTNPIKFIVGDPIVQTGLLQIEWIDDQLDGLDNNEDGFNVLVD